MSLTPGSGASRRYCYIAERVGDQVRRRYLGRMSDGLVGLLVRRQKLNRAEAAAQREADRASREADAVLERGIRELEEQVDRIVQAHRQVRDHRHDAGNQVPGQGGPKMSSRSFSFEKITRDQFDAILLRAQRGHPDAVIELRECLQQNSSIWEAVGNLSSHVQEALTTSLTADSIITRESVRLFLLQMRADLLGQPASPVETLLVEQVCTCWLDYQVQQLAASEPRHKRLEAQYWELRAARAQRRYLDALETLARIQHLESSPVPY